MKSFVNTSMTRREFLILIGIVFASLSGITSIKNTVNSFMTRKSASEFRSGYGGQPYGG